MRRTATAACLLVLLLFGGIALGGCGDPLFPDQAPRSPYTRYSELRGEARLAEDQDAYGRARPALRERLAPLEAR